MTNLLHKLSLLQGLEEAAFKTIHAHLTSVKCAKGKTLFKEGEPSNGLYMLVKGTLEVKSNNQSICRVGAGKSVGEMGAITLHPRSADVIAAEDCELMFLSLESLNQVINQYPIWGLQIYKNVIVYLSSNLKDKNFIFEAERLLDNINIDLE
jgi:CRP/FNR family cyclic AMP-dependent transcriptional regulator